MTIRKTTPSVPQTKNPHEPRAAGSRQTPAATISFHGEIITEENYRAMLGRIDRDLDDAERTLRLFQMSLG